MTANFYENFGLIWERFLNFEINRSREAIKYFGNANTYFILQTVAWHNLHLVQKEEGSREYERLKKQERERLERDRQIAKAKDYSIDLLRYLDITTDGMMPEDVIQLYTENSMELERLIFEHNRAEEEKAKKVFSKCLGSRGML